MHIDQSMCECRDVCEGVSVCGRCVRVYVKVYFICIYMNYALGDSK